MSASADRNLLFGILALQLDFVNKDALISAMNAWALDKGKALGDILRDQGQLSEEKLQLLSALVTEHLRQHGDDPKQSLAALSSVPPTLAQDLAAIPNADLLESIDYVSRGSLATIPPREGWTAVPSSMVTETTRYRILRPHAKGGLGEVYVAEDQELGRPVALKEIQGRYADDRGSRERFVREAEITGGLEHPGIVPVYGLGTYANGRPFYAMRFIKGDNLKDAIRRFHSGASGVASAPRGSDEKLGALTQPRSPGFDSLAFRQLLRRFIDVCNAIAYAHSRGVLHRDLKPGNIMLGKYGETLVVDWGLAKPLGRAGSVNDGPDADTTLVPRSGNDPSSGTVAGQALGTPAYMPPEQANGDLDQLGPASDVYSLGATLYELLTGRPPFAGDAVDVLMQVCDGKFAPPRTVNSGIPRPMEAICLKAMSRNRSDRYSSALELSKEVERWLADEPVTAWHEPWTVRSRRWVRKHSRLVTGLAAALCVSLIAIGVVAWLSNEKRKAVEFEQAETAKERDRANSERDLARTQKNRTRQALDTMISKDMIERLGTQKELMKEQREFLQSALAYYREFAAEAATEEEGRKLVANANFQVARLLFSLGQYEDALPAYRAALSIHEKLAAEFPAVSAYRQNLAMSHNNLGVLLSGLGLNTEAADAYRAALPIREKLAAEFPSEPAHRQDLAMNHHNLGDLFHDLGQIPEAADAHRAALAIREKLAAEFPGVQAYRQDLAKSHCNLGIQFQALGQKAEATVAYRAAIAIQEKLAAEFPAVPAYRQELTLSHNNLGVLLKGLGQNAEAAAAYRAALAIREKLAADFPAVPDYRQELATSHFNLGILLRALGKNAEAADAYRAALAIQEKLAAEFPAVPAYRQDLASSHHSLGVLLRALGQNAEAADAYHAALAIQEKMAAEFPAVPDYRQDLARSHVNLGNLHQVQRQNAEAADAYRAALAIQEKLATEFPAVPKYRQELATSHHNLGALLSALGQSAEATNAYRAALAIREKLAAEFPVVPAYRQDLALGHNNLGILLRALGQNAEAADAYRAALAIQEKLATEFPAVPDYAIYLGGSYCNYGNLVRNTGDPTAAVEWHTKAVNRLAPIVAAQPRLATARQYLRNSYWGRATALVQLKRLAEALPDWEAALKFDEGSARLEIRVGRADCLARVRRSAEAVREAEELAAEPKATAPTIYDCASVMSLAAAAPDNPEADIHGARAVELLRQAIGKGYRDIPHLLAEADLAPLRKREDYAALLWDLADVPATKPKS